MGITYCTSDKYVKLGCDDMEHPVGTHFHQIRHLVRDLPNVDCEYCVTKRRKTIIAKAMDRYKSIMRPRDKLILWTVGTSLSDSPGNRLKIARYWKLLGSRMRTYSSRGKTNFSPLMNALEKGTRGGKLHYHFIARSFMSQSFLKKQWRNITGEKSNVNFKAKKRVYGRTAIKAFAYLAKYCSKDGLPYYWMGDLLKVKVDKWISSRTCKIFFSLTMEDGWHSMTQTKVDDYFGSDG